MKPRFLSLVAFLFLLAACQPGLRPYDGVVGYTMTTKQDDLVVKYVEPASYGWPLLEQRAREACALKLNVAVGEVVLDIQSKEVATRDVDIAILTGGPSYTGDYSAKTNAGGRTTFNSTSSMGSVITKTRKSESFNELAGICRHQ